MIPVEIIEGEGSLLPDMTYGELSGDIEKFSNAEKAALITATTSSPVTFMTGLIKKLSVTGRNTDLIKLGRLGGYSFGGVSMVTTAFFSFTDGSFTIGDGARVLLSGATMIPYVGWAYGAIDAGTLLITGASVTDRVGTFVDEHWGPGPVH